jgi:hypothetical protein
MKCPNQLQDIKIMLQSYFQRLDKKGRLCLSQNFVARARRANSQS